VHDYLAGAEQMRSGFSRRVWQTALEIIRLQAVHDILTMSSMYTLLLRSHSLELPGRAHHIGQLGSPVFGAITVKRQPGATDAILRRSRVFHG